MHRCIRTEEANEKRSRYGAKQGSEKIRLCDLDRQAECREIHADEPPDRAEDCYHVGKAPDYPQPDPDCVYRWTGADRISGYAWDPQGKKPVGRVHGQCGGTYPFRGGCDPVAGGAVDFYRGWRAAYCGAVK